MTERSEMGSNPTLLIRSGCPRTRNNYPICLLAFRTVKVHKQKIAGKSIPFEKFAVSRADRYQQSGILVLPGLVCILSFCTLCLSVPCRICS